MGANDYEIRTEYTALDIIIGLFTGVVTVDSRTVTVRKLIYVGFKKSLVVHSLGFQGVL